MWQFPRSTPRRAAEVALSIDVEDWFHSENVKRGVNRDSWDQCEARVERNTMRMLDILSATNTRATFFVLGWVAQRNAKLVREIAAAGHEIASHGFSHQLVYSITPEAFRDDVARAKGLLEDITGLQVRGYRAPCFSITPWAIPILQETGHFYDSSMVPTAAHDRYGSIGEIDDGSDISEIIDGFHEVRVSCLRIGRHGVPWGGGGYFRFMPYAAWKVGIDAILSGGHPYVFYIHPWEIDPDQPRVDGMSALNTYRQRVNLHRCEARFEALCARFHWLTISEMIEGRCGPASSIATRYLTLANSGARLS